MSEQMPEQAGGDAGVMDAVAKVSDGSAKPVAASSPDIEPRLIAPDQEAPMVDTQEPDTHKADAPRPDISKPEAPKAEAPKVEPPPAEPPAPGQILLMSPGDRSWHSGAAGPRPEAGAAPKRRISAMAAVIALAALAGALSGALATAGVMHFAAKDASATQAQGLVASVARIDADVLGLKASVEHTSKMAVGQYNKASDRLDRLEKAQAEPAARLARLSDAVDKLRAAQATAPAAATPRETTGSIAPPAVAAATSAPPRAEVARLPTVDGWVLRNVSHGGALIEGRQGLYEVYAGDPVPGLGRIDAIRRQDGRWVVVTSKGLIVAR